MQRIAFLAVLGLFELLGAPARAAEDASNASRAVVEGERKVAEKLGETADKAKEAKERIDEFREKAASELVRYGQYQPLVKSWLQDHADAKIVDWQMKDTILTIVRYSRDQTHSTEFDALEQALATGNRELLKQAGSYDRILALQSKFDSLLEKNESWLKKILPIEEKLEKAAEEEKGLAEKIADKIGVTGLDLKSAKRAAELYKTFEPDPGNKFRSLEQIESALNLAADILGEVPGGQPFVKLIGLYKDTLHQVAAALHALDSQIQKNAWQSGEGGLQGVTEQECVDWGRQFPPEGGHVCMLENLDKAFGQLTDPTIRLEVQDSADWYYDKAAHRFSALGGKGAVEGVYGRYAALLSKVREKTGLSLKIPIGLFLQACRRPDAFNEQAQKAIGDIDKVMKTGSKAADMAAVEAEVAALLGTEVSFQGAKGEEDKGDKGGTVCKAEQLSHEERELQKAVDKLEGVRSKAMAAFKELDADWDDAWNPPKPKNGVRSEELNAIGGGIQTRFLCQGGLQGKFDAAYGKARAAVDFMAYPEKDRDEGALQDAAKALDAALPSVQRINALYYGKEYKRGREAAQRIMEAWNQWDDDHSAWGQFEESGGKQPCAAVDGAAQAGQQMLAQRRKVDKQFLDGASDYPDCPDRYARAMSDIDGMIAGAQNGIKDAENDIRGKTLFGESDQAFERRLQKVSDERAALNQMLADAAGWEKSYRAKMKLAARFSAPTGAQTRVIGPQEGLKRLNDAESKLGGAVEAFRGCRERYRSQIVDVSRKTVDAYQAYKQELAGGRAKCAYGAGGGGGGGSSGGGSGGGGGGGPAGGGGSGDSGGKGGSGGGPSGGSGGGGAGSGTGGGGGSSGSGQGACAQKLEDCVRDLTRQYQGEDYLWCRRVGNCGDRAREQCRSYMADCGGASAGGGPSGPADRGAHHFKAEDLDNSSCTEAQRNANKTIPPLASQTDRIAKFYSAFCKHYVGNDLRSALAGNWSTDSVSPAEAMNNYWNAFTIYRNIGCKVTINRIRAFKCQNWRAHVDYHIVLSGELAQRPGVVAKDESDVMDVITASSGGLGLPEAPGIQIELTQGHFGLGADE